MAFSAVNPIYSNLPLRPVFAEVKSSKFQNANCLFKYDSESFSKVNESF